MRRKIAATIIAGTAALGGIVATAPAAHAGPTHCADYLRSHGYIVGPIVAKACTVGAHGQEGRKRCATMLTNAGVTTNHASAACIRS